MSLTERERAILRLRAEGLSDYRIAQRLRSYPVNVSRSRKSALRKLEDARVDLEFAKEIGVGK